MATIPAPVARERATRPTLVFFASPVSGQSRRVEGFLAQVLQRRRNHGTFRVRVVDGNQDAALVEQFHVTELPTLVVVEDQTVKARLVQPRGCRDIEALLSPWLK